MVRFSDLLGGDGDSDESRPATVSAPLVTEPEPVAQAAGETGPGETQADDDPFAALAIDETPAAPVESPEDVLDRLTQYATSARAGDQAPEAPDPAPDPVADVPTAEETVQDFERVGDDLLPSGGARKPSRSRKRRP
jgi:hypothetical protein